MSGKPKAAPRSTKASVNAGPSSRRPNRFLTPINIVLMLAIVGIAAAAVWQERKSEERLKAAVNTAPAPTPVSTTTTNTPTNTPLGFDPSQLSEEMRAPVPAMLPLFATKPPTLGLDPPGPTTRVPVNSVDLFTNKPIGYASPRFEYKGYQVAFCCKESVGYRAAWAGLTEPEKDTYIRHFVETGGAP